MRFHKCIIAPLYINYYWCASTFLVQNWHIFIKFYMTTAYSNPVEFYLFRLEKIGFFIS